MDGSLMFLFLKSILYTLCTNQDYWKELFKTHQVNTESAGLI